ncbi:hypothetical protein BH10PLA1_BH10PLA1_19670 [soil metagenome]
MKRGLIILLLLVTPALAAKPPKAKSRSGSSGTTRSPADSSSDVVKYEKSTPEQDARAITDAQDRAAKTSDTLHVKFTELQTTHFIIFTDWDPREYNFLKTNVEGAYTAVARQFEMSPKDNIFIGKLPIYMFAKRSDFMSFAAKIDKFDPPKDLAGYCQSRSDGFSHMAMSKPDPAWSNGSTPQAERIWAYTLTHEFTHAFVARYRTNRNVPRWLNEGLAEVVADGQFPRAGARQFARTMAKGNTGVSSIFNDDVMPPFQMYPVMMTMTEALIRENPKKFLKYFNEIKDGAEPEECLKSNYNVDYGGLEDAWRKYIKSTK